MKGLKELLVSSDNFIHGIAAAPGLVIGNAHLYVKEILHINDTCIEDIDEAITGFHEALAKAKKELNKIFDLAREKMGEERADIFAAQMMILDDAILINTIENRIRVEKKIPEYIVNDEITKFQDLMILANEYYMKERAMDIEDIKNRIIRNLQKKRLTSKINPGSIVVSETLTPADTLLLSHWDVKAYVTDRGGLTSHASIIARSLDIPAVVGTHRGSQSIQEGDLLIVDGFYGFIFINPTEHQLDFYREKIHHMYQINLEMKGLKDKPAETLDGREITIMANVDVSGEIEKVFTNGAKGIGLYRTEQIIEEMSTLPTEDEQAMIYENLAIRIFPHTVIIRAFDMGGDKVKLIDFKEANPFLGLRGIRFLLENPAIFKSQIKAILRASIHNNIHFMLPMVSAIEEIRRTKVLINECKKELLEENRTFGNQLIMGVMIEVPAAAVMAFEYASEVDFLSIGTNDLIQYLMAVDRGNDVVSGLYQEFHPAVIKTIQHIIKEGKRAKVYVSMCGEMAADNLALPILVGLGLDSISVSPSAILPLKRTIRAFNYEKAKELAERCVSKITQDEVIEELGLFFEESGIPRTRTII